MEKEMLKFVLDSIREEMRTNNEAQGKILHGGLKGIRIYVDANGKVLETKIQKVIDQNERQNGILKEHTKDIVCLKEEVRPISNLRKKIKKPVVWLVTFVTIGIGIGLYEIVYHEIGLYKAFLFIKNLLA